MSFNLYLTHFLSSLLCFISSAAGAIESLCNQLMKDDCTFNLEWILAVPILHFLRGESKPFEEPDIQGWPKTPDWWGAHELEIGKFRKPHGSGLQ